MNNNVRVTSSQNRRKRKSKLMHELIVSLFSGLVDIFITLGYQHFFAKTQSLTIIYNGEKLIVTESDYIELENKNKYLQNEINSSNRELEEKYSLLQNKYDALLESYDDLEYRYNALMRNNDIIVQIFYNISKEYKALVDETTHGAVDPEFLNQVYSYLLDYQEIILHNDIIMEREN